MVPVYICILKGCKDLVKLVGVYISVIHLHVFLQLRGVHVHEIYIPSIEQSDWSECTSHGTNTFIYSTLTLCQITIHVYAMFMCKLVKYLNEI